MTSTSDSRVAAVKNAIETFLDLTGCALDDLDDVALQLTDSHEHDYDNPDEVSATDFAKETLRLWNNDLLHADYVLATVEHVETFTHAEHGIDATVAYKWKGTRADRGWNWPFHTFYRDGEWFILVRPTSDLVIERIRSSFVDREDLVADNGDFHIAISVNQPAGEGDPATVVVAESLTHRALGEVVISYQEQAVAA